MTTTPKRPSDAERRKIVRVLNGSVAPNTYTALLLLDCGHYVEPASHFSYVVGDDWKCFKCRVAADALAASAGEPEVTEMAMCEIDRLVLHAGQTYRFTHHAGCALCAAYPAPPSLTFEERVERAVVEYAKTLNPPHTGAVTAMAAALRSAGVEGA